jgi:hypothetical protein
MLIVLKCNVSRQPKFVPPKNARSRYKKIRRVNCIYRARARPAAAAATILPMGILVGVAAATDPIAVTVGWPPLRAPPDATAKVETALATAVAPGTPPLLAAISLMLLDVALKLVGAKEISLLLRSYTTYALRRNVSPRTEVESSALLIPVMSVSPYL